MSSCAVNRNSLLLLALSFIFISGLSFAEEAVSVSSKDLIEKSIELDGKNVLYKGEVVGAILKRDDGSWFPVYDGLNTISVWCDSRETAPPIKFIGGYKATGDSIEVDGVFNRACRIHGGELDIHLKSARAIKTGFIRKEEVDFNKALIAIAVSLITIFLIMITKIYRR